MAKLNSIIFCDRANQNNNQIDLINIFDTIVSQGFPALHPAFVIYVNIDVNPGDSNEHFRILRENREILRSQHTDVVHAEKQQFIHHVRNTVFESAGRYEVQIFINDQLLGNNYFHVMQG